jgi:IS5 family transposase
MNYRKPSKNHDLFSALSKKRDQETQEVGILKLNKIIDWADFRGLMEEVAGYSSKDKKKGGRPPFDPVLMLKILILQKYYGLSDERTEYEINDRLSFLSFLGLELGDDVPDARTIWDFKERIEAKERNGSARLFEAFTLKLSATGFIAKEGSIVDASFINAPRQRNSRDENAQIKEGKRPEGFEQGTAKGRQKDCEARWAKKNNETQFGWKNHIKADAKTKLIATQITADASVHDSQTFTELVDSSDERVLADSAYHSEEREEYVLKDCDAEEFLMRKGQRKAPLSKKEGQRNKRISKIRVRVEHVFGRMSQMGADYCRTIGLKRAKQHNSLCNLTYNMDRYAFLMR